MGMSSPSPHQVCSATYTGNDSTNRAIPHTLGKSPKLVIIFGIGSNNIFFQNEGEAIILIHTGAGADRKTVTAMNQTSFYVGDAASYPNSANAVGTDYRWIAIG